MAAERGWPPGWCTRRREPSASERKRVKQRARMKEGGRAGAGREGYHNITNHRRRDVSIQPLTLAHVRAFLALVSTTPTLVPSSLALVYIPSSTTRSRRFAYTLPKFPARNSHERSHPAIVALYTSTPHPDFSLSRTRVFLALLRISFHPVLHLRSYRQWLFLVLLPHALSRSPLFAVCIRSRRKCTPASATRSGFSFHAQWQSPFDADSRLTRLIRSPHYAPHPRRSTRVAQPLISPSTPANGPYAREK